MVGCYPEVSVSQRLFCICLYIRGRVCVEIPGQRLPVLFTGRWTQEDMPLTEEVASDAFGPLHLLVLFF